MITIKWIAVIGFAYILIGIVNYRPEWGKKLYTLIWDMDFPTRKDFIDIGIGLIIVEIIFDVFINSIICYVGRRID